MSEQLEYDRVGNIGQLIRDGNLTAYSYTQGSLQEVWGTISGVYSYDASGNALTDRSGFAYTYNHLNLPGTASKTGVSISYSYDALGNKRSSEGASGAGITRDYLPGGIEYTNGILDRIATAEGYITFSGSTPVYQYYLRDHLGNVRTVFSASGGTATVIQQQDYYPFGLRKALAGLGVNPYLYNGKELQGELGQYDYGARFYDPVVGRWNVVDPMAENHFGVSPYAYVLNNPIRFIDPDGMAPRDWYLPLGALSTSQAEWHEGSGAIAGYTLLGHEDYVFGQYSMDEVTVRPHTTNRSHSNRSIGMEGYFEGPPSGQYGPWKPDAVGLSIHGNIAGFSMNVGIVQDEYNEIGIYGGFSGGPGYTYFGPGPLRGVIGFGLNVDFYDNQNIGTPVLEGIQGGTYDFNVGYGGMIGYGMPIDIRSGDPSNTGVHRVSLGIGTGFRANRSMTWKFW